MQMPQSTSEALTVLSDVLSSGNLSANRTSPYRHLYTSEGCVSEGCGLWAWVMGWWLDLDDLSFQLFQLLWLWFYDSTSQTPSTFLIPQILGCIRKLSAHVKPSFKSHSLVGLGSCGSMSQVVWHRFTSTSRDWESSITNSAQDP